MRILNLLTCGAAVVALALSQPATAQTNNQSDVTGGNVTSSAVAGGGTVAAEASATVAAAVATAGSQVVTQLATGTLTTSTGQAISAPAQAAVLGVLTGETAPVQLVPALAASGAGGAANDLAQALDGLISSPATGQLAAAAGHFNDLVMGADPAFLANPPAEFLAVMAVMENLIAAAQGAG